MAEEGQSNSSLCQSEEPEPDQNVTRKKEPVTAKPTAEAAVTVPAPPALPAESFAQTRLKAEIVENVDPNTLPPTYSMVSYCPFIGKCCFLPMNFDALGLGTACNDHCTTMLTKTKAIWDDKLRVNIDCDINPNLMQQEVKVLSMKPKQAAMPISAPPPSKPKTPPPPATATVPPRTKTPPPVKDAAPVQRRKSQAAPQQSCQQTQVQVVVCTQTKNAQGADEQNCQTVPMPQSRNAQMIISNEPGQRFPERHRNPSLIFSNQEIVTDLNIDLLRKDSEMSYLDTNEVKPGISGMKNYVEIRNKNLTDGKQSLDFVDYFAKKDGCKYIGMLEQIFIEYFEKTKTDILFGENEIPDIRAKAEKSRDQISQIFKIIQVDEEKQLQDYDFPSALEKDCKTFDIDYLPKVMLIGKLHNYGVKMILYWIRLLETKKKPVMPERVYDVATELMADVMVICYGIYTKIADFLVVLTDHPTEKQLQIYSLEYFIRAFRNLVDCICDEIGAIGESAGQIMIRIPNITRQKVVDTMTLLYKQVNFAHLSISRAMEAIAPVLHLYHIRYSIMGPQGVKQAKPTTKTKVTGKDSKTNHHHKKHKKKK